MNPVGVESIGLGRNTRDHNTGLAHTGFGCLVVALEEASATAKEIDGINVNGIDISAIIGQQAASGLPTISLRLMIVTTFPSMCRPMGLVGVVTAGTVFENFNNGQGSAWQKALESVGGIVEVSDIAIEIGTVGVAEAFDIALEGDTVSKIVVLTSTRKAFLLPENRVVNDNTVDTRVVVGIQESIFDIEGIFNDA